jgi:2-keto-4-pentenoate hydratase/2-oxohepta-3-ene-1,7-dioic acid hydratase in catechol pathway
MKLARMGEKGAERPVIITHDGTALDASSLVADWGSDALDPQALSALKGQLSGLPPVDIGRYGPCVARPGKFICVGLNYADHAAETGAPVPDEPVLFMKATSAVCGPNDDLEIPRGSTKTDWEVELGVVIGRTAKYVPVERAMDHVAGYCVVHDVSERAFQLEGTGQWVKGKSCDTFGPIGPWLVTKKDCPDPHALGIWLEVDGERVQDGSTRTMIFRIPELVSYISRYMSLQPGDIISTGTPPGVGLGMDPPRYLKEGSRVRLGIEGLGEQAQTCILAP